MAKDSPQLCITTVRHQFRNSDITLSIRNIHYVTTTVWLNTTGINLSHKCWHINTNSALRILLACFLEEQNLTSQAKSLSVAEGLQKFTNPLSTVFLIWNLFPLEESHFVLPEQDNPVL